jgi:hypothetical protein
MELLSNMGNLMKLHLMGIGNVDLKVLDVVAKKCPHIKKLRLTICPLLNNKDNVIREMFSKKVSVYLNFFSDYQFDNNSNDSDYSSSDSDSSDDSDY